MCILGCRQGDDAWVRVAERAGLITVPFDADPRLVVTSDPQLAARARSLGIEVVHEREFAAAVHQLRRR